MGKKIFVTRKIPDSGIKLLKKAGYSVKISPHDRVLNKKELIESVKGVDGILCLLTDKIDGKIMDSAGENLKIIANYAVGYDNIDIKAAKERKITITNTPGVLTNSVAEHAMALILSSARRIAEADRFVRAGKYKGWEPMLLLGSDLHGKELGIVGSGRIGEAIAQIAYRGYKMKINYHDIKRNWKFERKNRAKYMSFHELLKKNDFITLHVPLLDSTHHLIASKELKMMKKSAYLINTSRGPIVDEKALAYALKVGRIKGAALDVFEFEPKVVSELNKLDNVTLTPHVASATTATRSKMSEMAASSIIAVLSGKKPKNKVK